MTHEPPAISIDRHVALGNMLKDVFNELADIMDNSGANRLIVDRTNNTLIAINRLMIALEEDLNDTVVSKSDPRSILDRVYRGDERLESQIVTRDALMHDAFAGYRDIL